MGRRRVAAGSFGIGTPGPGRVMNFPRLGVILLIVGCFAGETRAQHKKYVDPEAIDVAVKRLIKESGNILPLTNAEEQPTFTRPHPLVAKIDPSQAPAVAERIIGKFTDNPLRDAYVRWHLMPV